MPRITRYWAHDPIGNSEGILAGYEPDALKAAQDRGIIFIAELDDGTRLRVDASDVTEPEPASYTIATPDYVASRVTLITDALDAVADILDPQPQPSALAAANAAATDDASAPGDARRRLRDAIARLNDLTKGTGK